MRYREIILKETDEREFERLTQQVRNSYSPNFQGNCEGAAADLAALLKQRGIQCRVMQGIFDHPYDHDGVQADQSSHVWVEIDGYILDPTAEQFDTDETVIPMASEEARRYDGHEEMLDESTGSQYWTTVYHGDEKENAPLHRKMFFSSDRRFASDYGAHITTYELNTLHFADTLDPELIEQFLPLHDHYDDRDIETMSDYMDRSSDTWEMIEEVADRMIGMTGAAGLIIYEGGCKNYMVYDTSCLRPASEALDEARSWINDPKRCTMVTLNALCDHFEKPRPDQTRAPMHGVGVLEGIRAAGLKFGPLDIDEPKRQSVKKWVAAHPTGAFYISTVGHAMAVIDGKLYDGAGRGLDGRIVQTALEVYDTERVAAPKPRVFTIRSRFDESGQTYFGGFTHPPTRTVAIKYLTGWCPYFALAVHDLYGGQIVFAYGQHFGVQFGDKFVDSRGITASDQWSDITPISREEVMQEIESGRYKCGYYEERELTKAKRLVKSLGLQLEK